jgi:cytochrome c-type biogenesis protein CcmH/NrfF
MGESAMDVFPPEVRRIGGRLACLCRTCVNTVGDCPMLQCHYSSPARMRIIAMSKAGQPDDAIVDSFVKEQGIQALSAPPAEGFNLLVWIMPWAAAALGLGAIAWYVKRYSKPAPIVELPAGTVDRFQAHMDNLEKDMAEPD